MTADASHQCSQAAQTLVQLRLYVHIDIHLSLARNPKWYWGSKGVPGFHLSHNMRSTRVKLRNWGIDCLSGNWAKRYGRQKGVGQGTEGMKQRVGGSRLENFHKNFLWPPFCGVLQLLPISRTQQTCGLRLRSRVWV